MSAPGKLAGFAALLVLVFGGAVAAGGAIGPERDGSDAAGADDAMSAHGGDEAAPGGDEAAHGGGEAAADPVRGLAASSDGLTLALQQTALERGRPTELRFSILGSDGQPVRDFEVEHEKRMHLIVVRRDGQGFQHLHPELGDDGVWHVPLTLPDAGSYRVFADFKHDEEARTLAADLAVDGEADYAALPAPATSADTGDGYEVQLDASAVRAGRGDRAELHGHPPRRAGPDRAVPGRRRTPRGAA